jgi:hypothetical protein
LRKALPTCAIPKGNFFEVKVKEYQSGANLDFGKTETQTDKTKPTIDWDSF